MFDPALSEKRAAADTDGQAERRPRESSMNVSPLDLRQQKFRRTVRGFDPVEVTSLLMAVADDYEQALRETDRLRQEVSRLEGVVAEHRDQEKTLQSTLTVAQKLADDIRSNAELEAQRIVREAQGRSELLLEKTQARLEDIQREIDGLKLKRKDVEVTIEATIQTLHNTLEFVREQDLRERDEKILLHRPRHVEAALQEARHALEAVVDPQGISERKFQDIRELRK
jgi:cell division initiation protein